ncbi:hypothetical protein CSQ79_22225 [Gloeocapsopsis sp. IPPAS B-1203]|nr:hypothetical protein CSQ79_22225 [Gloeocapsopsis sp. IPPAS B-1203]
MSWEKLRKEADQLSVSDRLLLVEAMIRSLSDELRTRPEPTEGTLTHLRGILKNDQPSLTDEKVAAMREERLKEKYL